MYTPHTSIFPPATPCVYRSSFAMGIKLMLYLENSTTLIMVAIVTEPKIVATYNTLYRLLFAAGYINNGISGSHGPRMKIVKSTHGVRFLVLLSLWA